MAETMPMTPDEPPGSKVHVEFPYLARSPLYKTEKPFATVFDVSDIPDATATNHVVELFLSRLCRRAVGWIGSLLLHENYLKGREAVEDIYNARNLPEGTFTLDKNGFEFLKQPNCLNASNAHDKDLVYNKFRLEMKEVLQRRFPQYRSIIYLDHTVRKRSALFPNKPGMPVTFPQPAALPHFDFTTGGSFIRMSQLYPGEPEVYQDREFDLINIWKVLSGPNNDWPLAVADAQSVDFSNDYVPNDVINERAVGENGLMYYNKDHQL